MQGLNLRTYTLFPHLLACKMITLKRSNGGVATDVTPFPQTLCRFVVCSDQSDSTLNVATEGKGRGGGIPSQSKSVLVTCVLVHVALPL